MFINIKSQLDELRVLKDGWYDGRGFAPSPAGLDWLSDSLVAHYSGDITPPRIYPVPEGGVRFEWMFGRRDISLEIDLHERSGEWHSLDLDSNDEETRSLNLDDKADWDWMAEHLLRSRIRGQAHKSL